MALAMMPMNVRIHAPRQLIVRRAESALLAHAVEKKLKHVSCTSPLRRHFSKYLAGVAFFFLPTLKHSHAQKHPINLYNQIISNLFAAACFTGTK
jgi:hypothetical protein